MTKTIMVLGSILLLSLALQPMADRKGYGKMLSVFRLWMIVSLVAICLLQLL